MEWWQKDHEGKNLRGLGGKYLQFFAIRSRPDRDGSEESVDAKAMQISKG